MTQDLRVGDTVELLHEGKPTGILGTALEVTDAIWVRFPFTHQPGSNAIDSRHLRRVEPEFIVQEGDYLGMGVGLYRAEMYNIGKPPGPPVVRVWRKVDETTMRVVWERKS
jgi:hypothetical protein